MGGREEGLAYWDGVRLCMCVFLSGRNGVGG